MMAQLNAVYQIENYIDTFALGHYARVLSATDLRTGADVAFKVMRPEHVQADGEARWEFRAFGNEAQILETLASSPHVVKLLDCGYLSTIAEAPADGEIESYSTDVAGFVSQMTRFAQQGWRPYLALEALPRAENLFYAMKPTHADTRRRLPSEEAITLALQFANLMTMAHAQGIVYLDHKLEHVYWNGTTLKVIDFNSSKQLGQGNQALEFTNDVHNLCVGILYPIFTGMSPQKTALRPQAGGMDVVERRYKDIQTLDFMMEPSLSLAMQDLLQRGAQQEIKSVAEFLKQLQAVASLHGRDFPATDTSSASRQARDNLRKGLNRLREGESAIREARDLFREALIIDGITEDLEDELRRLVKAVNEVVNNRVIP
ncbi:MAG: protein kinase domain-containing protein [Anaerolineae bacterium]